MRLLSNTVAERISGNPQPPGPISRRAEPIQTPLAGRFGKSSYVTVTPR